MTSSTKTSGEGTRAAAPGVVIDYQRIVDAAVFVFIACGAIGNIDPSPYDFASLFAMPLWFFGGFAISRSFIVFAALIFAYTVMGFLTLIPYWDNPDSSLYQYQSAYLALTGIFYALFMGNRTEQRVELCLKAYTTGAFVAATCGVLGYFQIGGLGEDGVFTHAGRASGTFKDPNVLGSFLVLPIIYLSQTLVLGRAWSVTLNAGLLAVIFAGMFLTFSRGAYGATLIAFALMLLSVFATSQDARMRGRIIVAALGALALTALVVAALLSIPETRDFFEQRIGAQEYDQGATGRFGNQLRSIPMLLERFMGFGPLRFRLFFDLEPHNSYVGAFANTGWIGGLLFILIIAISAYVGLRLMFTSSPAQRHAQIVARP